MHKITKRNARNLVDGYLQDPEMKYIVYNIRSRRYILHDYYKYIYRFSRRQSVWNQPIGRIENNMGESPDREEQIQALFDNINTLVEDTLSFKHKRTFSVDDCFNMLRYYFNAKTYLAYYDNYLGRVVLIKERDKSKDFGELIGSRYYFIDDLHEVINEKLGLSSEYLRSIMNGVAVFQPIEEIPGMKDLNQKLHHYLLQQIRGIDTYIEELKASKG